MSHPLLPAPISVPVVYVPQNNISLKPPPTAITAASDIINEYYYTFTYKPFIDMVNTALRACWTLMRAAIGTINAAYTDDSFPYLWWDEASNIATCVVPAQLFQTPTANNPTPDLTLGGLPVVGGTISPISIFFNAPLFNLFSSFTAFQNGYENVAPLNWRMLFPDTVSVNPYQASVFTGNPAAGVASMPTFPTQFTGVALPQQPNLRSLLRVSQEYPTTPLWSPVQSIVFTTSLLPIASSIVSTPVLFGQGATFTTRGNNSGIANILTDLEIPLEKGWQFKPSINYVPTAEYRLFDLNGNAPLSAIEISVNWKDTFGRLNQVRLGSSCNASIKIMFRRKDFQGVV